MPDSLRDVRLAILVEPSLNSVSDMRRKRHLREP
jgi:hypothetical protein